LLQLADRSLVQVEDGSRYRLLETIRQYGRLKLVDAGESDSVRSRHLDHYVELAETAAPLIESGGTVEWLGRLDLELDNMRAAMDWSLTTGDAPDGLELATAWPEYWGFRGRTLEGRTRIEALMEAADPEPHLRIRAMLALATLKAFEGSNLENALRYADEVGNRAREIGDARSEARAM